MKKLFITALLGAFLFTGCFASLFFSVKITDDITIMCESENTNDEGQLVCGFNISWAGQILDCNIELNDLEKGWKPMEDGKLVAGCSVIADIPALDEEDKDEAGTAVE